MNLHIISLNIPSPPNYGGVIDIFYKIKALSESGIKVHLHCFQYGRLVTDELKQYCETVHLYKRKTGLFSALSRMPYIVKSRRDKNLLKRLLADTYPILFEGLHTTFYLKHKKLKNRIKIVRSHNIEHHYYYHLFRKEESAVKKIYFLSEALKLKKYQSVLSHATSVAAISDSDYNYLNKTIGNAFILPAFHSNKTVQSRPGKGNYLIYHGDLSVRENIEAGLFLIDIFKNFPYEVIFAGRNPSKKLKKTLQLHKQFTLIENPDHSTMNNLVEQAHIVLLPTFQPTGIKLKLINSLFSGRFCLVNPEMVVGTRLEKACIMANSKEAFQEKAFELMNREFSIIEIENRKIILEKEFDNRRNIQLLIDKTRLTSS